MVWDFQWFRLFGFPDCLGFQARIGPTWIMGNLSGSGFSGHSGFQAGSGLARIKRKIGGLGFSGFRTGLYTEGWDSGEGGLGFRILTFRISESILCSLSHQFLQQPSRFSNRYQSADLLSCHPNSVSDHFQSTFAKSLSTNCLSYHLITFCKNLH